MLRSPSKPVIRTYWIADSLLEHLSHNSSPLSDGSNSSRGTLFLRRPPGALLHDGRLALLQDGRLPLVDSLEPVAEAGADGGEDGVAHDRLAGEEGTHLEAELPEAGRGAFR